MTDQRRRGEQLFSERFHQIEGIVHAVAARRRLSADDGQELYSLVMLRVLRDNYAILRTFRGDSRWRTYLTVIVQRVLLDYRVKTWGRWRPSARTRRLGDAAIALDRRINRDGLAPSEAVRELALSGATESAAELERLAVQIPLRPRRQFVSDDTCLAALPSGERADRRIDAGRRRQAEVVVNQALAGIVNELPERERRLLELRFRRGWTVRRIAARLDVEERALYRRFRQLLARLRRRLEARGLRWQQIAPALDARDVDLHIDLS